MFRGLRRVLRDGTHPMRWLIGDEYNKLAHNAVIIDAHREAGQERRHHPVSLVLNGQRISGMDPAFVSQATIFMAFRTQSQIEIRALQRAFNPFSRIPDRVFAKLALGECLIGATLSTGRKDIYRVKIRPTLLHAGGETLRETMK